MSAWNDIWKVKEERNLWLKPDPFILSLLPQLKNEKIKNVLDLGFGVGRHAILLAKHGLQVYGVESSPIGLNYANNWAKNENLELKLTLGIMDNLPYSNEFFDLIVAWNVIYHGMIAEIRKSIFEIERCLKPSGFFLCSLISTKHEKYGLGVEIEKDTFIIATDKEKKTPHHYFKRMEIDKLMQGFYLLKCEDVEQFFKGDYHWQIFARKKSM